MVSGEAEAVGEPAVHAIDAPVRPSRRFILDRFRNVHARTVPTSGRPVEYEGLGEFDAMSYLMPIITVAEVIASA
jgi:hypothetical protein